MAGTGAQLERTGPANGAAASQTTGLVALWTAARTRWSAMAAKQRRGALVALGLLAALLSGTIWFGVRTDWRTLYAGLDPDDARQTGLALTQAQIPFDVSSDGTAIQVPAEQLDKARLATAAKGGVRSGRMGFELFDKPNWVGSEFDEQVNYQRAMEGELEHTVGTLSDIESARVHLVMPHDSLFKDQERPAKASVVLKLRHASLADGEADAIRNLVASAVDGLAPDRVVLVDAAGHLPLGPMTVDALRLNAEQQLEEKLIATLEPVTGPGNVRVSLNLAYDDVASDETDERYDPTQTATLSMQRTEESSGGQPVAAGVPGTASNAPNAQTLPVFPKIMAPNETSKSESGTYGVSKTVRHMSQGPGRVRRMTAAIIVNDHLLKPATKAAPAQWQPWPEDAIRNLTALAQAAVGFDPSRGDVLTVKDIAFDDNRPKPAPSALRQLSGTVENSPQLLKYSAFICGVLAILIFGVRPALRMAGRPLTMTKSLADRELPGAAGRSDSAEVVKPAAIEPERLRAQEVFEQVRTRLKQDPAQSSRLIQSWIHSE